MKSSRTSETNEYVSLINTKVHKYAYERFTEAVTSERNLRQVATIDCQAMFVVTEFYKARASSRRRVIDHATGLQGVERVGANCIWSASTAGICCIFHATHAVVESTDLCCKYALGARQKEGTAFTPASCAL
jgi:hypothetical protein